MYMINVQKLMTVTVLSMGMSAGFNAQADEIKSARNVADNSRPVVTRPNKAAGWGNVNQSRVKNAAGSRSRSGNAAVSDRVRK